MSEIKLELPRATLPSEVTAEEVMTETSSSVEQMEKLTSEEKRQVEAFAKQINLHDSAVIACYGEPAQRKLESFTDTALKGVSGHDVGEIGNLLSEMSVSIKDFNADASESKVLNLFRSAKKKAEVLRVKYTDVSGTLERVKKELSGRRTVLLVDIKALDKMYEQNLNYYKELTMYILAGKQKLEETRATELEELRKKAEITGTQEDAFAYSDLKDCCENFEKQLYDLELTRAVCLQMAPQIRLVQKTDQQLVQRIQSSINNSIPIWKQSIAIALAIQHNEEAAEAQKEITDLTSKMFEDNAKRLHASTVAAAKEAERGIIDIEALKTSNAELLATIDDVIAVQEEGRKARAEAEIELRKAEDELKQKLIGSSQRRS